MPTLPLTLRLLWVTQHNRKQEVLVSKYVHLLQDSGCQVCLYVTFLVELMGIQFSLKGFKDLFVYSIVHGVK